MKLLITGASGVLGSELVRGALAAGDEVIACTLQSASPGGCARVFDICDRARVSLVFEESRPDAVVHTAYLQGGKGSWETNVEGSRNVARAAFAVSARMVHVSSDLVFDGTSARPYREEDEARPVFPYGRSKLAAERAVIEAHRDALLVRPSLFYGGALPSLHELLALGGAAGQIDVVFFTDELRSPTPVPDLAGALLELARGEATGLMHLAGPEPLDRYSFARAIVENAGGDPSALRAGLAGELAPERPRTIVLDSSRAEELLGRSLRSPRQLLGRAGAGDRQ